MSKEFDNILSAIKQSMKGKNNPKTGKAYTDSDLYAIATAAYQKKYGKNPTEKAEIVVAENVKVYFNSYAEVIEE